MAHAYTPGLRVTERTVLSKRRLLPIAGSVLVSKGDRVTADTVVARAALPGKVHAVNVANLLGVAPDEIRDYLVKREGEPVRKDEVIAANRPFIKFLKTEVRSPIDGTVESVSTVTGQVLLREPPRSLDVLAYIDGTIAEVHTGYGVTVETPCALVQGIFGVGGETWGELCLAVSSPEDPLRADQLTPAMRGQIVVGGAFVDAETVRHARALGVAALVVGGIHDRDLRSLLGYDLGVAITGTEVLGLTVILTEGFGTIPMATKTFRLLSKHQGRKASVSGATQIRAGVIRPEIIIPDSASLGVMAVSDREPVLASGGLRIGDSVRIIRDPLFGRIGRVAALPTELRQIETESYVRVLEVEFPDKTRVVVPRANVEILEGE
jgi:hypothetical protein